MRHRSYAGAGCPVEAALERIDGKWKGVMLYHLLIDGTLRFNELARRCNGATPRVLARQLRELEAAGLVARVVFATVPARVDYSLTTAGETLRPVIIALRDWGRGVLAATPPAAAARPATAPPGTDPAASTAAARPPGSPGSRPGRAASARSTS